MVDEAVKRIEPVIKNMVKGEIVTVPIIMNKLGIEFKSGNENSIINLAYGKALAKLRDKRLLDLIKSNHKYDGTTIAIWEVI